MSFAYSFWRCKSVQSEACLAPASWQLRQENVPRGCYLTPQLACLFKPCVLLKSNSNEAYSDDVPFLPLYPCRVGASHWGISCVSVRPHLNHLTSRHYMPFCPFEQLTFFLLLGSSHINSTNVFWEMAHHREDFLGAVLCMAPQPYGVMSDLYECEDHTIDITDWYSSDFKFNFTQLLKWSSISLPLT